MNRLKAFTIVVLFVTVFSCFGCNKEYTNDVSTTSITNDFTAKEVILYESFIKFSGSTPEIQRDSFINSGPDFCTDAYIKDNNVILVLTENQINNLVRSNDDWIERLIARIEEKDTKYKAEITPDYQSVKFYIDENLPLVNGADGIYGIIGTLAQNQILLYEKEWSVYVEIINCNTGEIVSAAFCPQESIQFNPEDWRK